MDENNNVVKQYELVNGTQTNVIEFVSSAGKAIPNSLKNNAKIQKALQKALEAIAKGRL